MANKNSIFANRSPIYFGGLLLGLAAGVGFYKMKRAMMPHFYEQQDSRSEVTMSPGASIHFSYGGEDPGYFLIPGMPTGAIVSKKSDEGKLSPFLRLSYGQLVERDPILGPIPDEGNYNLDADFYICAEPGVADCAKLTINQDFRVDRNSTAGDARVDVDLPGNSQWALKEGNMAGGSDKNRVSDKEIEKVKDKGE